MLASGHTFLRQENTTNVQRTRNKCAAGANCGQEDKKRPKKQNKAKKQLPLLKSQEQKPGSGEKAGSSACPLHVAPPAGWADHLSCLGLKPWTQPALTPHKDQLAPTLGSEQARGPVVCSWLSLCSRGPEKDLPEFLVWPFANFY